MPLPVPSSLGTLLGERLARLPADAREVLLVAAAARPSIDVVAATRTRKEPDALEVAVREGVVSLEGSRIRFSTRCSPRFATSKRRSGTAEPHTELSQRSSTTSRSELVISRLRQWALTQASPPTWRPQPSRPQSGGHQRQLLNSPSSLPP